MRKNIILLFIFLALFSCVKDIDTYKGGSGIYFDSKHNKREVQDTIFVSWGLKNSDVKEQDIKLRVCLYGNTAEYDRQFSIKIEVETDETFAAKEGTDYKSIPLVHTIKANTAEAFINITLLRNEELKNNPKRFKIKLIESPELAFIYSRRKEIGVDGGGFSYRQIDFERVISMNENFPPPSWWFLYGNRFFGKWSIKKSILICDVMNIDRETWMASDDKALTQGYLKFTGRYMHRWLQEQEPKILDEDGKPMEMGKESQN